MERPVGYSGKSEFKATDPNGVYDHRRPRPFSVTQAQKVGHLSSPLLMKEGLEFF